MKFSVLMSVYIKESRANIEHCFSSIYLQSLSPNEIILVLDGRLTTELYEVIDEWSKKLPIKTIPLDKNVGLGKALNIGLSHCLNDLVARMDTDDICMPFRFEKQIKAFLDTSDLDICGSYIKEFDNDPNTLLSLRQVPISNDAIRQKCIVANPFNHMTVMYRKEAVLAVGGYQDFPWMEDWYLWLRMLANGSVGQNIPEYLVKARTGQSMIKRRSGVRYLISEWKLSIIKCQLGLTSFKYSFFIFMLRGIPRLLPPRFLFYLYTMVRKIL